MTLKKRHTAATISPGAARIDYRGAIQPASHDYGESARRGGGEIERDAFLLSPCRRGEITLMIILFDGDFLSASSRHADIDESIPHVEEPHTQRLIRCRSALMRRYYFGRFAISPAPPRAAHRAYERTAYECQASPSASQRYLKAALAMRQGRDVSAAPSHEAAPRRAACALYWRRAAVIRACRGSPAQPHGSSPAFVEAHCPGLIAIRGFS